MGVNKLCVSLLPSLLCENIKHFFKLQINGTFTLDENLADTQGLKLAFKAMNTALAEDNELEKKKLTNFESWNQQKLFFLSFANVSINVASFSK